MPCCHLQQLRLQRNDAPGTERRSAKSANALLGELSDISPVKAEKTNVRCLKGGPKRWQGGKGGVAKKPMFKRIEPLEEPFVGHWMVQSPRFNDLNTGQLMCARPHVCMTCEDVTRWHLFLD